MTLKYVIGNYIATVVFRVYMLQQHEQQQQLQQQQQQ